MRIGETSARRGNDRDADVDSCSSSSSTVQASGICPSCRLAVNKDTGRLKWCMGGNDVWRTRIRYMLLIPAVILPVTIIVIALSKSAVIGKLSMRSSSAGSSASDDKPSAILDHRIYAQAAPGDQHIRVALRPDVVETSFVPDLKTSPLVRRHKRDMSQSDAAGIDVEPASKRHSADGVKSGGGGGNGSEQPRELSSTRAPPQVRSRQARISTAEAEAMVRNSRRGDCNEEDSEEEDEDGDGDGEDEEEEEEEDASEASDEESVEEEENRAAKHWRTRSAAEPFEVPDKSRADDDEDDGSLNYRAFWKRNWNEDFIRRAQAKMMSKYMDETADPCQDFYQYSCGNWEYYNPIPEDKAAYDTFEALRESLDNVLKQLLEEPVRKCDSYKDSAILKAKNLFRSCMNYEILEQRMEKPLMELLDNLGGWPILKSNWDSEKFDWLYLVAQLRLYNNDILISESVGPDIKNSDEYVIQFDQTTLGLPSKDYFLQSSNAVYLTAYKNYLIKVVTLLGAPTKTAKKQAEELVAFEVKLANITLSPRDKHNSSDFYKQMTLEELHALIPQIDWYRYLTMVLGRPVSYSEPVVIYATSYLKNLVQLLAETPPRTVANYLLWRFVRHRVNNLDDRFQEAKQSFYFTLYGREKSPSRWKTCVAQVNSNMGLAVGSIFVKKYFDENSKNDTLEMTREIQGAFRELLHESDWLDDFTKKVASEKVKNMRLRIGYPDLVLKDTELDQRYKDVDINPDKYFENTLNILHHLTKVEQSRLGSLVNKSLWNEPPAIVNAFYSRNKNQIMFPAGILQPPFYHRYFPRCLNYGGIGVVIGHEITHGFDDKGRLFDKYGNVHQWWSEEIIKEFDQRAFCLVDQYSRYVVKEVSMRIDGINTQGENIADNGGIKQAFRAYEKWLKVNGDLHENLPGINATGRQLFFINFAQVWCGSVRPEAMRNKLKTAVHPPGKFRLIGTISNFEDFAKVFNCPVGSPMNPEKKCIVW